MRDENKKFWITYILVLFLIDSLLIGLWAYLDVRTREYVSNEQVIFPIREGWIVQIKSGGSVFFEAADDAYFYLRREESPNIEDVLVAYPKERPVDYSEDTYYYLEDTVSSSNWLVEEASLAEGRLKPSEVGDEIQVRIYAEREAISDSITPRALIVLLLSALVSVIVADTKYSHFPHGFQ